LRQGIITAILAVKQQPQSDFPMALAIFDLDNTLIAGDSDHSWGEFLVSKGKVDRAHYRAMNDRFYADYKAGKLDIFAYLEFSLEPLTRIPQAERQNLQQQFMQQVIAPLMLTKAQQLIDKHRQADDHLLVITATSSFIAKPICSALGISDVIATEPEIVDGDFTGKITGIPSFAEGKVERLKRWLQENQQRADNSYFYSDSINDLPLLLQVTYPVAVDPDAKLREQAIKRGWKIISLRN
jgi:HAD superfamily hydrolase (TIGR01490 family)